MFSDFALVVKSTIDYKLDQFCQPLGLNHVDLSAASISPELLESDQPCLIWEYSTFNEAPIDPMWAFSFDIGLMHGQDPAQYITLDVVGKLNDLFRKTTRIFILDYTKLPLSDQVLGVMAITECGGIPQQTSDASNLRFLSVSAVATRFL